MSGEDEDYVTPYLDKTAKRIRIEREEVQMEAVNEKDNDDFYFLIEAAIKDARAHLHRTKVNNDPIIHRAHVFIVCDCFIHSCEPVQK